MAADRPTVPGGEKVRNRLLWIFVPLWIVCVLAILVDEFDQWGSRELLRRDLSRIANANPVVVVDGQPRGEAHAIIGELLRIEYVSAHHSSPGRMVPVEISSDGDRVCLVLGRDSQLEDECWVAQGKRGGEDHFIGRIHSRELAKLVWDDAD